MRVDTKDLVGTGEIAERLNLGGSAVSNWPKRHADFPKPVLALRCGDVWRWSDIERWLESAPVTIRRGVPRRKENA